MRYLYLVLMFCLGCGVAGAQGYSFYDTGAVWGQYYQDYVGNPNGIDNTTMRHVSNDTINGKRYARIELLNPAVSGGYFRNWMIRDSSGYIFKGRLGTTATGTDTVLAEALEYNFNLQVNDTFIDVIDAFVSSEIVYILRQVTMDTMLDGSVRKKMTFIDDPSATYPKVMIWIEGIGDIGHGLAGNSPNVDSNWGFLCYSNTNGTVYNRNLPLWPCDGNLLSGGYHPDYLDLQISSQPATCNQSDGYYILNAVGGSPPFTFSVNGSGYNTGDTVFNLAAGFYFIDVFDNIGNHISGMYSVVNGSDSAHDIDTVLITHPTCGQFNGRVEIVTGGGTARYDLYSSFTNSSTGIFTNVPPGTYTAHIVDTMGCEQYIGVALANKNTAVLDSVGLEAAGCNATDGAITLYNRVSGPHISYSIDGGQTFVSTSTFSNLSTGMYNIAITDTAGCRLDTTVFVDSTACVGLPVLGSPSDWQLNLYPNPGTGVVHIDMGRELSGKLLLTNALGQTIYATEFNATHLLNLDLDVKRGIYFVTVQTELGSRVSKLLVE